MKKKIEYILMLILFALSLIYTNSATNIIKKEDPIMKSIMKNKNAYKIESVNAKIENDTRSLKDKRKNTERMLVDYPGDTADIREILNSIDRLGGL